ncbi:hypothetical protein DACRYDRAFT_103575 [Dacryopinax primogenitus]|uniref:DH domain-containing protein n=1 Tax=Dacryopinax primogenitus (strain DJM 731) TaxID=1858805 RepID=M5GD63_DACPD|nr:uncharacterized protein DACRYDRAFT_103575 [Dacryopinax primogenitus]EJU06625.1 hypothetical protein DACRYDRAFT_103575 [Dacryopinax primogenitus]
MSYSPRKIPLNASDSLAVPGGSKTMRRAFFCSVVVESSEKARLLGTEMSPEMERVENLLASLGEPLASNQGSVSFIVSRSSSAPAASSMNLAVMAQGPPARRRSMTNGTALQDTLKELITTERSYVTRLRILKKAGLDYADQLRAFAKRNETAIIPMYEANTLFGNVDALLLANESFLCDLETMVFQNGYIAAEHTGDIALKHFRELKTFDCYKQYYAKREEAQKIFESLMVKNKAFAHHIETIKYSASDSRNRVGLRELLMDPVQRIPRYTMMFRTMLEKMDPTDVQRPKLSEACDFANKVALCEADDPTKKAAIMYRLERAIEGFPPGLISSNRRFIDCIDVEDLVTESPSSGYQSSSSSAAGNLPCTLFLFDDTLMIVKRLPSTPGRSLAGLDDIEKATQMPLASKSKAKPQMSCRGVLDILDVVATDPGGANVHMFLEKPPHDQTDRWAGRPFRSYVVVVPPAPVGYDPITTQERKQRFLNSLWTCQAEYRTRQGRSTVRYMPEREIETVRGKTTFAKAYFNVYHRTAYLGEPKKGKIVLHVDPRETQADDLPFGVDGGPYVIVRVQPMEGDLARIRVTTRDPAEPIEEDIIETAEIPARVINTIQQYRLFHFHTGTDSTPHTPHLNGGTARSRTGMFVLENLFNSRPGSVMGDVFGTINGHHKRTKSSASRVSTFTATTTTTTTTTGTGSFKFSSSRSTSTAQTSIVDDDSFSSSSPSRRKSTIKRPISQISSPEARSPVKRKAVQLEEPDEDPHPPHEAEKPHDSEWDLSMRLELARNNSQKQESVTAPRQPISLPSTISEESWQHVEIPRIPYPAPGNREVSIRSSSTNDSRPRSATPTQATNRPITPQPRGPRLSRPSGPRTPINSPHPSTAPLPTEDLEMENIPVEPVPNVQPGDLEDMLADMTAATIQPPKLTQSDDGTAVATPPRPILAPTDVNTPRVEPLSIVKKSSVKNASPSLVREDPGSPTKANPRQVVHSLDSPPRSTLPQRKHSVESSNKTGATRHGSQQGRTPRRGSKLRHHKGDVVLEANKLLVIAETTREDMNSSRRALKKIKLEVEAFKSNLAKQVMSKDPINALRDTGLPRSPKTNHISNRFTEERMAEMRLLLEQGGRGVSARAAAFDTPVKAPELSCKPTVDINFIEGWSKNVESLLIQTDAGLKKAVSQQEDLHSKLKIVLADAGGKSTEVDKVNAEIEHLKKQCAVLKKFLDDATTEKEIMYDAFNEELDGMFNDVSLPATEAWQAITKDLQKAKDSRNQLTMQNTKLQRELEETKLQNEHYETLLRKAGLL